MNNTDSEKEINIIAVIANAYLFFKKRFLLILSFVILGLIYGSLKPTFYKTYFNAYTSIGVKDVVIGLIDNLQEKVARGDHGDLSKLLNISIEDAKKIKSISAKPVEGITQSKDIEEGFQVHIEVTEIALFNKIKQGLVYFIAHQPYLKERADISKSQLKMYLDELNKIISELETKGKIDSKLIEKYLLLGENKFTIAFVDLYEKKLKTEKDLKLFKEIGFIESDTPAQIISTSKSKSIAVYGFLGFILSLILIFTWELKNKVDFYIRQKTPLPKD